MTRKNITFCYRKIIDASSEGIWEKMVFEDTYMEFLMQFQNYNQEQKYYTFSDLVQQVKDAGRLHYLVSPACIGYLQQLNEKIPDILNTLGKQALTFKSFRFEIINSDIRQKSAHQVAINLYSEPLIWHETIGEYLLVSAQTSEDPYLTDMIRMVPFLSVATLQDRS